MSPGLGPTITISVPAPLRDYFLAMTIRGHGGFQSLGRLLAERLQESTSLHLTSDELRRIVHYARAYGDGGFQTRLRQLVVEFVAQHFDAMI